MELIAYDATSLYIPYQCMTQRGSCPILEGGFWHRNETSTYTSIFYHLKIKSFNLYSVPYGY
jgi:hypothetical protein